MLIYKIASIYACYFILSSTFGGNYMELALEIVKVIFPTFFMIFIGYLSTRYNLMS